MTDAVRRLRRRLAGSTGAPAAEAAPPAAATPTRTARTAKTAKTPPAPRPPSPLGEFAALVRKRPHRVVVILAHDSQRLALEPWLRHFARDRVHVVAAAEAPEWELAEHGATFLEAATLTKVGQRIKALGPLDVIVTLLPAELLPEPAADDLELWARLFRFLRPHGSYVLDRRPVSAHARPHTLASWMRVLVAAESPEDLAELGPRDAELARSTRSVAVSRDLIVVTKRLKHYVKVREAAVHSVLPTREPRLRVTELASQRAGRLVAPGTVTSYDAGRPVEHLDDVIDHPSLALRRYEGKVALPGSGLMFTGFTILPDSFRWHLAANPSNPRLRAVSYNFARVESAQLPHRTLEGSYYQLDSAYPGHFGHLTTEVVSRLWGWDRAKEADPDLKVVFHVKRGSTRRPALELALFTAYGIDVDDIVWVNEPVWLESVASAAPMWHNEKPHYVHPEIAQTWRRITDGLLRDVPPVETAERIFVSRSSGYESHRFCRNTAEVEAFFAARGFRIVLPEHLSLPEQAAVFGAATTVAGFGGSALFNLMHARDVRDVIVLSHDSYTARNEHLFSAVLGCDTHYFWSRADVTHPEGDWTTEAFFSAWEFDFERHARTLDELLASL